MQSKANLTNIHPNHIDTIFRVDFNLTMNWTSQKLLHYDEYSTRKYTTTIGKLIQQEIKSLKK